MASNIFVTKSSTETQQIATQFSKSLKGGEVLAFFGNLGSGKTTFIQGLAKGLGVKQRIISPSFIIVREYALSSNKFYHVDLYRIENSESLKNLGLSEIIGSKDSITAIEWAEKLKPLPKKRIEIHIEYLEEDKRKITVQNYG